MGRLVYGCHGSVEIYDRALAHLRIAFMHKLRRSEPFMFTIAAADGSGRRSFWIHPAADLQFHFFGNVLPTSIAPGSTSSSKSQTDQTD